MDKILISIYVFSLDESYDLFLPIGIKMNEAIDVIQKSLVDISDGNYVVKDKIKLYDSTGKLINQNNIVKFSGIKNGCKLLLV